jgi:hypothetical protein
MLGGLVVLVGAGLGLASNDAVIGVGQFLILGGVLVMLAGSIVGRIAVGLLVMFLLAIPGMLIHPERFQTPATAPKTPPVVQDQAPAEQPAEWEVIPSFSVTPDFNTASLTNGVTWDDALPSLNVGTRLDLQRLGSDVLTTTYRFPDGGGCLSKVVSITFRRPSEPDAGPYKIVRIACKLR